MAAVKKTIVAAVVDNVLDMIEVAAPLRFGIGFLQGHNVGVYFICLTRHYWSGLIPANFRRLICKVSASRATNNQESNQRLVSCGESEYSSAWL